jgi:hypothetical protein
MHTLASRLTSRRAIVGAASAVALGIGSAVWATSSAFAAPARPSATIPMCTASNLAVWVNLEQADGAAGTGYYPLEFTNISGHACGIGGYPGVSATGANGKQLGDAAGRDPVYPARSVTIPAGGTAHALFSWGDAEVTTSGCKPTTAHELKVYPPNSKTAISTFFDLPSCTVGGSHVYLHVSVIVPGTNIR